MLARTQAGSHGSTLGPIIKIPEAPSSPTKAPLVTYVFSTGRGGLFSKCNDMEAVLKQNERISRSRYQLHRRPIGGRLLSSSWRTRTRLAGLGEALSKHFWTPLKTSKIDFNAWSYSLRTACAACLALYISFSLNLDESHWAFTTCYIVGGQRLQGKILAKSLARIVGTLVGAIASFALVNAFAQHGVLFITSFAAWLSLCAFFSHSRRDDWAYAWVLSGYTTAIRSEERR